MSFFSFFIYIFIIISTNIICFIPQEQLLNGNILSSDYISENTLSAFDKDTSTSFKSYDTKCWIGLDLLSPHYITKIAWAHNSLDKFDYILGIFEASNSEFFYDALPLYMIKDEAKIKEMNYVDILTTKAFRYVRYVGPPEQYCIISEIQIFGYDNKSDIFGYINREEDYIYQLTNLPLLVINTGYLRDYVENLFNLDGYAYLINNNKIEEEGKVNRKYRGNGSLFNPKISYRLRFLDGKKTFLNFKSKSKDWVLISNYVDKALIRNLVSLEISRLFGMKYTVDCKLIDLITNGLYFGNYMICEKIEVNKNKMNISKLNESGINYPDITGGYLIEIDSYMKNEISKFISFKNNFVTIKYPKEKKIMPEQHMYIENKFNEMERRLFRNDLSRIDIDSFVQFFLIQELSANSDAYWSVRMYKERNDEVFYFGPVWDFDIAFDNDIYVYPVNDIKKFIFDYGHTRAATPKFIEKIIIDRNVIKKIKSLWKYVFENKLKDNYLVNYIDEIEKYINESQRINFIRWKILDKFIMDRNPVIKYTYENEIKFLREFVPQRIEWMNENILGDKLFDKYISNNSEIIINKYIVIILLFMLLL